MNQTRVHSLRPTAVNQVLAEVRQLQSQGKSLVSLMRGQPDLPTPAHIVEAAERALRDGRTGYPDNRGEREMRQAVAEKISRTQGLDYDPNDEILITDGATCGVHTALAALLEPGDEVLLPSPIYDAYNSPIALWGGLPKPVQAQIKNGRFIFDKQALEAARSPQTRILLINTPWNPVGTVLDEQELPEITQFAVERRLWIISDEIYESLVYDGRQHVSPAALGPEAKARTVIVNSLSKTYAMTGWRIGYCAGPAEIIRAMFLILQQFSRGPATFVQDAAAFALRSDQSCVEEMRQEYQSRRDLCMRELSGIAGVSPMMPEGGLFVMVDVRGSNRPSNDLREFLLKERGVVLVHGAAFGPGGEGTLRVSFAAGGKSLQDGLACLREGLSIAGS